MPRPTSDLPAAEIGAMVAEWIDDDDAERLVVTTSGSTGTPRRVVLSREAVRFSAEATHQRLGGAGCWLLTLPASYVAGVQVLARSALAGHAAVVRAEDESLAEAIGRLPEGRRYCSLVPTQLRRLIAASGGGSDDEARRAHDDLTALSELDAVLLGGGPVDERLRAEAHVHGIRTVATYGSAETAGGCVYDGVPLDGVGLVVGRDGRIMVSGPVLFDGYEDDPEGTAAVLRDGWFLTSDIGQMSPAGVLEVRGRADDVVVSGGVNVPGAVVARTLLGHPSVEAVEVLGVPDPEWGRRLVAFVVGDLELDAARDWVAREHPRSWAPREVVLVEELPMLPQGKVDRQALLDSAPRPPAAS